MSLACRVVTEHWPMVEPFVIARETMTHVAVIVVTLTDEDGRVGHGEAAGVDYDGETPARMIAQIDSVACRLDVDLSSDGLRALLPAGGARNAIDAALWDLRAARTGIAAAMTAGCGPLKALETVFTIGLGTMADIRRRVRGAVDWPILKLKLDASRHVEVLEIVGHEHPRARLIVDANQAWDRDLLETLLPHLVDHGVELIEQPLPRGADATLAGLRSPIPIAADESCTDLASLDEVEGRYEAINIKLDKCGGLSEALAMLASARRRGLLTMVGNMCGTSLAMAPAFLIAQQCRWADLDGPLLQRGDRAHPMRYARGIVHPPPPLLWGGAAHQRFDLEVPA